MFKSILNIFKRSLDAQEPKRLGVPELPIDFYQRKPSVTSMDFKVFVNEIFGPLINQVGFEGKDFFFFRKNATYTEGVFFWTYKYGGAIQVDLFVKFNDVKYPSEQIIKSRNLRGHHAEFFRRLSEKNQDLPKLPTPWFWLFRENDRDNRNLVEDIWRVFSSIGLDYFNRFENNERYIGEIDTTNYLDFPDFQMQRYFARNEAGILFFLFDYWRQQKNINRASAFAALALKKLTNEKDTLYRQEFTNYLWLHKT